MTRYNFNKSIYGIMVDGLAAFLFFAFGLSFAAASYALLRKCILQPSPILLLTVTAFGLFTGGALFFAADRIFPKRLLHYARVLLLTSLLIKLAIVTWGPHYEQSSDCQYLQHTVEMLGDHGFGRDTILGLSRIYYDDYLWIGRVFPLFYPLYKTLGAMHVRGALYLNCILSTLGLVVAFRIFRTVLPQKPARYAMLLFTVIPIHYWLVLDYTHQIFGALLVMTCTLLTLEIFSAANARKTSWGKGALLGIGLSLLRLQGGMDLFMLALVTGMFILVRAKPERERGILTRMALPAALALLIYVPSSGAFRHWENQYKPYRMSSHPISFMARGWNLETGGEHYGRYEQIDRLAPYKHKAETMQSLILSVIAHEPVEALVKLPLIKIAKFFLVGFATDMESKLNTAGSVRMAQAFTGMRVMFAPPFLMMCMLGCMHVMVSPRRRELPLVFVTASSVVFCVIYLVCGETSPRYSFHIHFALAMTAGMGVDLIRKEHADLDSRQRRIPAVKLIVAAVCFLFAGAVAAAAAYAVAKIAARDHLMVDMRNSRIETSTGVSPDAAANPGMSATLAPFEQWLAAPAGTWDPGDFVEGQIVCPDSVASVAVSFYMYPPAALPVGKTPWVTIMVANQTAEERPLSDIRQLRRVQFPRPSGYTGNLSVAVRITHTGDQPLVLDRPLPLLQWGYVKTHSEN